MYFSNKIFNFPIQTLISFKVDLLNLQAQGGGGVRLPSLAFCLLLQIYLGNPYLKILANLFVAE